uniref:Uncharacterized protein n=1 Tax=Marseillevirus LCMAC101 TaxID=2506602 RepID=A0A481YQD1_9VIRU|nr:MAG: hypothetical protein LCMAC101_00400 [Marseillevirus LCMAC101]
MAATATPYINGMKKPLNMLSNPIYPDIKKRMPRFVWSRKFWQVDPGATLRDTEEISQFRSDAILAQARDYNQTVYGQSSHKDIVNATFRPPLLDPIEDFFPLSRIPVTSRGNIIPTINPSTVADGGTSGYLAQNSRISGIDKFISDRIKAGEWRATFSAPIEIPQDNSVLPDLEMTIPSVSAHAGFNPYTKDAPVPEVELKYEKLQPSRNTGVTTQVRMDGGSGLENMQLGYNNPQISASAGYNPDFQANNIETYVGELPYNNPQISASAGFNPDFQANNIETDGRELSYNNPQISASAGFNPDFQANNIGTNGRELPYNNPQISASAGFNPDFQANNIETYVGELPYNRPPISVTAGMNTPYEINGEFAGQNLELETHIEAPLMVANPGTEDGYHERMTMSNNPDEFIHENRPSFSYRVPETYVYKDRNELTHRPQVHEKLQPLKSYGQISHAGAYKRRLYVPKKISMRRAGGWADTPKIKNYSFGRK